jgi:hypothetical protein
MYRHSAVPVLFKFYNLGAEHGLRLTLNAERYNAMPGPHDANGIKLLATSVSEFPRVEEIGIAIPTGAHAFVGLGVLVVMCK